MQKSLKYGLLALISITTITAWSKPSFALHDCSPLDPSTDFSAAIPCRDDNSDTRDEPIRYIVIHTTEGSTLDGAVHTLLARNTSSHYVIGPDGTIVQMVNENRVAFHAGNLDYNEQSIGIEHVGISGAINLGLTPEEYIKLLETSAALIQHLAAKYCIPRVRLTQEQLVQADREDEILSGLIAHADIPNPHPEVQDPHPAEDATAVSSHDHHVHPKDKPGCIEHWGGHSCHTNAGSDSYWDWPIYLELVKIRFMDFEDGVDAQPIRSTIPGMTFTTTQGFDWIYGDIRTGNYNVKTAPDPTGPYATNWNFFAWLGRNQGLGRIDFTGATATEISLCYSSLGTSYLEAYDSFGNLIDSNSGPGNLATGRLDQLSAIGTNIAYILFHDAGNFWLIDDLSVQDLLAEAEEFVPPNFNIASENLETANPNETKSFTFLNEIAQTLKVILHWPGSELLLQIYQPDETLYAEQQSSNPPIELTIPSAEAGTWNFDVTAVDIPSDNYPFALVIATSPVLLVTIDINKVEIEDDEFEVEGSFTLAAESDGIDPLTEDVTLTVGTLSTTIPAGSFELDDDATFEFEGVIDGIELEVEITPVSDSSFDFEAEGEGADMTGSINPIEVTLTIGNDSGAASVIAELDFGNDDDDE